MPRNGKTRESHAAVLTAHPQGKMKFSGKAGLFPEKLHKKGICPENMTFSWTNALKQDGSAAVHFRKCLTLADRNLLCVMIAIDFLPLATGEVRHLDRLAPVRDGSGGKFAYT